MTTLWSRLRALGRRLWRRGAWERTLDDELQAYLDREIDARIDRGLSPAQARRTALADFGGVEQVKERVRSGVTGAWLDTLWQDLRMPGRALRHSRGFTAWIVGSLAIGMAVTIAALALLIASLVGPLPGRRRAGAPGPRVRGPQLRPAGLLDAGCRRPPTIWRCATA